MDSDRDLLRQIPLFQKFGDAELDLIASDVQRRTFAAGEIVVRQGEIGTEMYLITAGEFQVYLRNESLDLERQLNRLKAGRHFGEIALVAGVQRTASVRAVTESTALVMHREVLQRVIERSPQAALLLCEGLGRLVASSVADTAAVPFISLREFPGVEQTHSLLPPRVSCLCQAVAFDRRGDRVKVALVHPEDDSIRLFIRSALRQYAVEFAALSDREFEEARKRWFGDQYAVRGQVIAPTDLTFRGLSNDRSEFAGQDRPLERILAEAIGKDASDVHLEPTLDGGRLRLRIDGLLFPAEKLWSHAEQQQIVTQLKVIAGLDTTGRRLPQDGHFQIRLGEREIDVRLSVLAANLGEKAVLRLLAPDQVRIRLDAIAVQPSSLMMRDMFSVPDGLVLVCGPTGSGKSTTLYAGLHEIQRQCVTQNIVTIEDPVEYQIEFATQIQVNRQAGLDFPQIMRAVLRQDPDVILVGEIRDVESARLAIEAAMTGHVVCSSLHAGYCLDAVTRMRHLEVQPYQLAAALRGIVAQRLVPQVCKSCGAPVSGDDPAVQRLLRSGTIQEADVPNLRRGAGCEACLFHGDSGRLAVLELLVVDDALREAIEDGASAARMKDCLSTTTFSPMHRYAAHLLRNGMVAPESILNSLNVAVSTTPAGTE